MDSQEHDNLAELQNFMKKDNFPQLEGYEIQNEIGKGGFGVVYLAKQTALQREVAIKMIFSNHSNTMAYKRFLVEAQIIARLKHLGIAEVYDFIHTQDDKYFMVMEYLPGKGLEEVIANNEFSILEAVKIICDIADILAYSHSENIIHRDIKPSNIRIDIYGNTKLLDFGLARVNEGLNTLSGQAIGTPQYMPPEQAQGNTDIDVRSDIYSLGVVMYELLTGKRPFSGNNTAAFIYQAVHGELKKPSSVNQTVDGQLEAICLKAMARDRQQRYQTAEEMRRALQSYLNEHQKSQSVASQISCIQQSIPPFKIKVWVTVQDQQKNSFAIGEKIQIHFESECSCYLYLVNIGPTQDITVLYPNGFVRENYIKANTTYSFPRKEDGFDFELQNPPGEEMIYALGSVESIDDVWGIDWQKIDSAFLKIPRKTCARNIAIIAKEIKQQPSKNWSSYKCLIKKC